MNIKKIVLLMISLFLLTGMVGCQDQKAYNDLYTVIFYTGADTSIIKPTYIDSLFEVEEGSLVERPEDPTSNGATFLGWYKEKAAINEWDFDNDRIYESTVIYSSWEITEYAIEYIIDEAGGTFMDPPITTYSVLNNVIFTSVAREGSRFVGWVLTPIDEYKVGDPILESTTGYYEDLHLYALFDNKDYIVRFRSNLEGVPNPTIYTIEFSEEMNFPVLPDTATKHFVGWFALDGTETGEWGPQYVNGEVFLGKASWNEDLQDYTFRANDVTLYGKWEDRQI